MTRSAPTEPASAAPPPDGDDDVYVFPASYAQQRLWFLHQLDPSSSVYHLASALRLIGALDPAALAYGFRTVVERHETLRTTFLMVEGAVRQVVAPRASPALAFVDLRVLPERLREPEAARLARDEAQRPFDLARGPLLRATLLRLAEREHGLLVTMHHIISDARSMEILTAELTACYSAYVRGARANLPDLPIQYADYAIWQQEWLREGVLDAQLGYWKTQLADLPALDLPADYPQPPVATFRGAVREFLLPADLQARAFALGQAQRATPFMLLATAWLALLARYSGQGDFAVGTPVSNRARPETEPLIGFFVNTLTLRADLRGDPSFLAALGRVREVCLAAYAHQDAPFERIVEALPIERDLSRNALFQVIFAFDHLPAGGSGLADVLVQPLAIDQRTVPFALGLRLSGTPDGLAGALEYSTDLFATTTILRMAGHFRALLAGAVAAPDRPLGDLPLLNAAERQQILREWNDTGVRDQGEGIRGQNTCVHDLVAAEVSSQQSAVGSQDACVHDLVAAQAARAPDAVALAFQPAAGADSTLGARHASLAAHLSYGALIGRAHQLAHHLRARGCGPETRVALALPRTPELAIALLGVLAAGSAAVPLDPDAPAQRRAFLLRDSGAAILVTKDERRTTNDRSEPSFVLGPSSFVDLGADWPAIAARPTHPPAPAPDPDNLAYLIYTSGSAGAPKAVLVSHRGLTYFLRTCLDRFAIGPADCGLWLAAATFDIVFFELFAPLIAGGSVVLADPRALLAHPLSSPALDMATLLHGVPSLLRQLVQSLRDGAPAARPAARLRQIWVGGERVPPELLADLAQTFPHTVRHAIYGPTEATIFCAGVRVPDPPPARNLIGAPLPGRALYVLDARGRIALPGSAGELYIGGDGLARGYLGRPDLTAVAFVPNPFSKGSGVRGQGSDPDPQPPIPDPRLYRTGDRARWRMDGVLEFLGRTDAQIKLRGIRIEPGEVAAALAQHPSVREAAVVAREDGGELRLVAYIVPGTGIGGQGSGMAAPDDLIPDPRPLILDLRAFLAARLPAALIPSAFVALAALPLTAHGKLDRSALPAPDMTGHAEYIPPRTPEEELLAQLWAQVLGCARVGAYDNFFALGGHSLLATQLMSRVRATLGAELPLRALFEAPVLADLARRIAEARQTSAGFAAPPLRRADRAGDPPLSFAQQRLWFLDRLQPHSPIYTVPLALRLAGALDLAALARSLGAVVRRHEALRTTFALVDGQPIQRIAVPGLGPLRLPLLDLRAFPTEAQAALARRLATAEARRPFDLEAGPLFRVVALRMGAREHVVVATMHHIIADAWSTDVLVRELTALYGSARAGRPADLPDLPIQYADYAIWQRAWLSGPARAAQLGYWAAQLRDAPALQLATDRPRPPEATFNGAQIPFALPPALSADLRAMSQREGCTLFMTLLAAWQALLARYSGQDDIVVGTPISNRTRAEAEPLIGFFLNTLALRTSLRGDPTFRELARRVRAVALDAYDRQDLPFEQIIEAVQPARDLGRHPLFQALFVLQHAPAAALDLPGLALHALDIERGTVQFDLALSFLDAGEALEGVLEYSTDLFDRTTAARMLAHLATLLAGAAADPAQRLADLPLLGSAERHQLLVEWNDTEGVRGQGSGDRSQGASDLLHELFAAQATRTPDAISLAFEAPQLGGGLGEGSALPQNHPPYSDRIIAAHLTYGALNQRANKLAHHLRALGAGPETIVGIALDRSIELIVAILGVLKTGGAYLPLDPSHPPERIRFLLEDSGAHALVTKDERRTTKERPSSFVLRPSSFVDLGRDWPAIARRPAVAPDRRADPASLAYAIYTSGSTGSPKGVLVAQRGLVNFTRALARRIGLGPGQRFLEFAPFNFDASALQVFPTLISGSTLVLHPDPTRLATRELAALCVRQQVTVLDLPAALWRQWVADLAADRAGLPGAIGVFLTGGERAPIEHVRAWAAMARRSAQLLSSYGPTEATVTSALFATTSAGAARLAAPALPLGRPLPGVRLLLLDRAMRLAPIGVAGEIYVGGFGLARGYLGRPDLTAAAFVPNPFVQGSGVRDRGSDPDPRPLTPDPRLYRTGDLARYRADGSLEFLGRADAQVKLRGYRVEPGEVEALLARHPAVRAAAVVVREDRPGDQRLVAYIVPAGTTTDERRTTNDDQSRARARANDDGSAIGAAPRSSLVLPPSSSELRELLAAQLPDYMLPSAFVILDALPVTSSGKIDRRALPAPDPAQRAPGSAYAPPRDAVELQLAQIWADLLAVQPVGVADDFFALGGHSLLAVRLMAQIQQQFGRALPLATLFQEPTIAQLAARLRHDHAPRPWSPLALIRSGDRPPLFCVHPAGGNILCYALLARRMAPGQPLYGLQARGLDDDQSPLASVEDLAAHYVAALRELDPAGPYRIAGWSAGGIIAFEMARQLHTQGRRVALLALLDAGAPQPDPSAEEPGDDEVIAGILGPENLPLPPDQFQRLALDQQIGILLDAAKQAGMLPPDAGPQQIARLLRVFKAVTRAVQRYQPGSYPGPITLFRSESPAGSADPADPTLGWGALAQQPVIVYAVPGSHATMLGEPHVGVLAGRLQACIDESEPP